MAKRLVGWAKRFVKWEVDWSRKRRVGTNTQVWARNPASYRKAAREWHWTTWSTIRQVGIPWVHTVEKDG